MGHGVDVDRYGPLCGAYDEHSGEAYCLLCSPRPAVAAHLRERTEPDEGRQVRGLGHDQAERDRLACVCGRTVWGVCVELACGVIHAPALAR